MRTNQTLVYNDENFKLTTEFKAELNALRSKINQLADYHKISLDKFAKETGWALDTINKFLKGSYLFPDTRLIYDFLAFIGLDIDTAMENPIEKLLKMERVPFNYSIESSKAVKSNYIQNTRYDCAI